MRTPLTVTTAFASLLLAAASASADITINFDVGPNGQPISAPAAFDNASPLRNTYAALGVHFAGPSSSTGGAILNDSTFTQHARSGSNFLAFSAVEGGDFIGPETITFDSPVYLVSIYAGGVNRSLQFTMQAFDVYGALLDSDALTTTGYSQLSVSSSTPIHSVVLAAPNAGVNPFVFDDLFASTTPPPPPCPADFNHDGVLNADDLADYVTGYFNAPADPATDFNGDGVINSDDLGDFVTAYFNGC